MTLEDIDLPYEYSDNTRAGTFLFVGLFVAASIALLLVHLFLYALPLWVIIAPAGIVVLRAVMFTAIRNGTHEALRDAALDGRLDEHVAGEVERLSKSTLTPETFAARFEETH